MKKEYTNEYFDNINELIVNEGCLCGNYCVLYVWDGEGVLEDYTPGMVCVLACCEAKAWELLHHKDYLAARVLLNDEIYPKQVNEPDAFVCWGGS